MNQSFQNSIIPLFLWHRSFNSFWLERCTSYYVHGLARFC